ncbi:MAG: DUF5916 domain-containing protein, partial [Hymenobacteraceae bacterium]|nr:DUF5916 domain-containing protein [Hymenobacteraceae bacterium]
SNIGAVYERRLSPNTFQNFSIYSNLSGTFKNFWSAGLWANMEPVKTNDFFEPRVDNRFYEFPENNSIGAWVSTDYRKKFALDVNVSYRVFDENDRHNINYSISPRYRFNDQLSFNYSYSKNSRYDDMGYANDFVDKVEGGPGTQYLIFGLRDVNTVTNTLSGSYIFNNRMSVSLRARHYWSSASYKRYFDLNKNGRLIPSLYPDKYPADFIERNGLANARHDRNYNAFNIDMVYSWWFAPGSEISIVWKNAISNGGNQVIPEYLDNFSRTLSTPQTNSLSIKILYFIDYLTLKDKLTKS